MYDRSHFERDTVLAAREIQWVALSQWCAGIFINTRFADMPFFWSEQNLYYCRGLRDAVEANMEVTEKIF